jgi:peptidoglycan/xylan/chitin deacetylase (PgdA/CDA1 family)
MPYRFHTRSPIDPPTPKGRPRRRTLARLLSAFLLGMATVPAHAGTVAITFDDLPVFGSFYTPAEGADVTTRLLGGLRKNHLQAIGFVNEIQLDNGYRESRIALLKQWLDAGMDLGNHSYSHPSLTRTPVDAYIADVAKGETVTKALLAAKGQRERYYRYPFLETGATLADRQTFEHWLADHGYMVAPASMENSDWEFAGPYSDALAHGDAAAARHIREAYLAYTAAIIPWYRKAATGLLGREPAFVMLLHASHLNADSIDDLAAIFRRNGLRSVSLDRALKDPAYRIPDTYVGPNGDEWVTRWSLSLGKSLPYASQPKVPDEIVALDARLNATPPASPKP